MVALSRAFRPAACPHPPQSGYRNIYPDRRATVTSYRVRVCKRVNLPGRFPNQADAAAFAADWLAGFFAAHVPGEYDPARAVRAVTEAARRNVGYVRRCGGRFVAVVYVLGEPQLVTSDVYRRGVPRARWGRSGDRSWATRADARAAIRLWVARFRASFGLFERYAGLWLWR